MRMKQIIDLQRIIMNQQLKFIFYTMIVLFVIPYSLLSSDPKQTNNSNIIQTPQPSNTYDQKSIIRRFYKDNDHDGFGDISQFIDAMKQPDGYVNIHRDCNDTDPLINPVSLEQCNQKDDNCNGLIDEGLETFYYRDLDGDGFGNEKISIASCLNPKGYVNNKLDCNDVDPDIHPDGMEICNEKDDDCNGIIDDNSGHWLYRDNDNDGFGSNTEFVQSCQPLMGFVSNKLDCNDYDPLINPDIKERCNSIDDNCNGLIDEGLEIMTFYQDHDNDGFGDQLIRKFHCSTPKGFVYNSLDCNDSDATINPNANEICNHIDDNCNTLIDENAGMIYYKDADGDSFGNAMISIISCDLIPNYVANANDCNDDNNAIHPKAIEICNGLDDDCDNLIDENSGYYFYKDSDNDGFGSNQNSIWGCTQPEGYVSNRMDCNDNNPQIHPNMSECCNHIDDNCNGQIDENTGFSFYKDFDGDQYGNSNIQIISCEQPEGFVYTASDCDDSNQLIHPNAPELCNKMDDNCNMLIDEEVGTTYFKDHDNDGYGDKIKSIISCDRPIGYVENNQDCDDSNIDINPNSKEICNGLDDNCNGMIDENVKQKCYQDYDSDGYGSDKNSLFACVCPSGYVLKNMDCNDLDPNIYPTAFERCNDIDDNCNFQIDESVKTVYYRDMDGDGYGFEKQQIQSCFQPEGWTANKDDCDDHNRLIFPGAIEIKNNIDDNCNGYIDEIMD